ncbi:hypothetical protein HOS58_gp41 [Streptomyces phage Attoomi]|uniref:Uncharacterized protein n=1 Tax=Streptomyces phage Attoomi TaxID=2059881 RepID=A0A2H5BLJ4_9CAUD|nr:hypothetical protein HOS58_gp41 [Streptomyces phage Attoomi]AUG87173.1 hypothetical protein SEA_ATTOOMI_41 [Streptomyces phage Attoomi]
MDIKLVHTGGRVWSLTDNGFIWHAFRLNEDGQPVAVCRKNIRPREFAITHDAYWTLDKTKDTPLTVPCDRCRDKVAALEAKAQEERETAVEESAVVTSGAKYQEGQELEFVPSPERTHGTYIPAGPVVVKRVVDHGPEAEYHPGGRYTYVVQVPNVPQATQGAGESELVPLVQPEPVAEERARYVVFVPVLLGGRVREFKVELEASRHLNAEVIRDVKAKAVEYVQGKGLEWVEHAPMPLHHARTR